MNKRRIHVLWISALFIAVSAVLYSGYDKETARIMPFVADPKSCESCHKPSFPGLRSPEKICVESCAGCHKDITDRHHQTGIRMKQKPGGIVLSEKQRILCVSCHDLSKMRFDGTPWKSQSLYDSLFSSDRYNTYYLVMKNSNGELCRQCHAK